MEMNGDTMLAALNRTRATAEQEPINPRVRINVKRLANGSWQPDITIESFDADPLTHDGHLRLSRRLHEVQELVDDAIADWEVAANAKV